jgi:hypothetical protein
LKERERIANLKIAKCQQRRQLHRRRGGGQRCEPAKFLAQDADL